jgi:hypothetical protein
MAVRRIFIPQTDGAVLVRTVNAQFRWFPGMSVAQKQRSVASLHAAAKQLGLAERVLEASSKSKEELGVALSAFNLALAEPSLSRRMSVECAFQASKVFQNGGPFIDILEASSRAAKQDVRLKTSGPLIGFRFFDVDWPLAPQTAFYDWLYISALRQNANLADKVLDYQAFTDIEFNTVTSINCQAYALALYVSLRKRGLLNLPVFDKHSILRLVQKHPCGNKNSGEDKQGRLL